MPQKNSKYLFFNLVIICYSWGNILGLILILNYGGEEDEMEKGEKKYFKEQLLSPFLNMEHTQHNYVVVYAN